MNRTFVMLLTALGVATNCSTMLAQTLKTLVSFNGPNGSDPRAGLVMDPAGDLYGATFNGGAYGAGSIFEVDGATHSLTTLFSFNGTDGGEPDASLTFGAGGALYGTTRIGGTYSSGTVFSFAPSMRSLTTLGSFDGAASGAFPLAPVVLDSNGNVYGTTSSGGGVVAGTAFEVDAPTHTLTTLFGFPTDGSAGAAPTAGVILDGRGNLFGTTAAGGANNQGTLFRLSISTRSLTTLASFSVPATGGDPEGGLIADASGNLYGTTFGGYPTDGTVFMFSPSSGVLTVLGSFNRTNGSEPRGGVIMDASGHLFGTTLIGGPNDGGTVFELDPVTNAITTLATFGDGFDNGPVGRLVADGTGNFFGTTTGGGDYGHGSVFELSLPEPGTISLLVAAAFGISMRRRRRPSNCRCGR